MLRPLISLTALSTPTSDSLLLSSAADLARSRAALILENIMLRPQLIVRRRQVKRPVHTNMDRFVLALLSSKLRIWKNALLIV